MLLVDRNFKDMFFDRVRVMRAISYKNLKLLSKAGAYVRQRARTKLRRRKASSAAGSPPSVHSRDTYQTLKNIQFGLHRDHESVVIGPRFVKKLRRSSRSTVPELMEFGGTSEVLLTQVGNSWIPGDRRFGMPEGTPIKRVNATYAARPFMGPALREEAAAGTLSSLYLRG